MEKPKTGNDTKTENAQILRAKPELKLPETAKPKTSMSLLTSVKYPQRKTSYFAITGVTLVQCLKTYKTYLVLDQSG